MAFKFTINDYSNIYSIMKTRFRENIGISNWNKDSIARNLLEPVVSELSRINNETAATLDSLQISKAKGNDLDGIASAYGLQRLTVSRAFAEETDFNFYFYTETTFGNINGGNDIVLPKGTRITKNSSLSSNPVVYTTVEEYILPANERRYYCSIQCTSLGAFGNTGKNNLVSHSFVNYTDAESKSLKCINQFPISNGANRESDADLRFRIYTKYSSISQVSKDAVNMRFLETPGVFKSRLVKNWFGIGTSALFVFGGNKDIQRSTINILQSKIDKQFGFTSRIVVSGGVRVYLDLDLTIWTKKSINIKQREALKGNIGKAVSNYFAELQDESSISLSEMMNKVNEQVSGISGFSNRYSRSKMIDAAYVRKNYASENFTSSERIKLATMNYDLKENEFLSLGNLNINIENE